MSDVNWVGVDVLPGKSGRYLVYCRDLEGNVTTLDFDADRMVFADGDPDWDDVTHWSELPRSPTSTTLKEK